MDFTSSLGAWRSYSARLATFTAGLVNRWDTYGVYRDGQAFTSKRPLTAEVLRRHFFGADIRVGLHLNDPDDRCRFGAVDVDAHATDPSDHLDFAQALRDHLAGQGARPLLEHSGGGWKVWVRFDPPEEAWRVRVWLHRAVAEVREEGWPCPEAVEVFPKQDVVTASGGYGSFLRLPGRHHRLDHVSYFRTPGGWAHGPAAAETWLTFPATGPGVIPAGGRPAPQPVRTDRDRPWGGRRHDPGADWHPWQDFDRRGEWGEILIPLGWAPAGPGKWRRPGRAAGVSATTDYHPGMFYLFSASVPGLEPGRGYSKSALFALLHHGGDFTTANKTLAGLGFGRGNQLDPLRARLTTFYSRPSGRPGTLLCDAPSRPMLAG
ncbi:MAG: hypothetical protein K2X82_15160 [Gemmataceae bacterium]|nr:hypothetical protein [Gemmataceae bacterium]